MVLKRIRRIKVIYPQLDINLSTIKNNTEVIVNMCRKHDIKISGVIKGFNGLPKVAEKILEGGVMNLASSRIDQLQKMKGKNIKTETLLLRIPMMSEIEDLVKYCDISLNSNKETLEKINEMAKKPNKTHRVILMRDLGDLREGVFKRDEFIELCRYTEDLENIYLEGIGTNLSCYGSIAPTIENMIELSETAEKVEKEIGRKLDIISGGGTTTLPLVYRGEIPEKINHLRVGEGIINAMDLPKYWDTDIEGLKTDTFICKAQVVESNIKPTHPIGKMCVDAFGNKPVYEDKGNRKRVILALGNQDTGDSKKLEPIDERMKIMGSSSDHTIVDVHDVEKEIKVGDVLEFKLFYQAMLFLTGSRYVKINYID
jgi:predicted amino acid racemase